MTKTEAKKLIKKEYEWELNCQKEKIVDWNIWKDDFDNQYLYHFITITKHHTAWKYAGYLDDNRVIRINESSGLLTIR